MVLGTSLSEWFVNHVLNKLLAEVEEFQEKDSGWTLNSIINIQINMTNKEMIKGAGPGFG